MIIFLILGAVASLFQLVIMREFVFSVAKNEFSLIAAIGVWLLFCSLGSFCGKRKILIADQYLPFAFTLLFCLCLVCIHSAKYIIGSSYYEATSISASAAMGVFLIGPLGFLVGYGFARFSRGYLRSRPSGDNIYARFFAYEAIGFFVAGMLFTFFLSAYANPFLFAVLPLLFIPVLPAPLSQKKRFLYPAAILLVAMAFSASLPFILKKEFQGAVIISSRGSPYGPLIEAERFEAWSLYASGNLVASSEDAVWQEAFTHTSIASCDELGRVLVIGAASVGQLGELAKYDIGRIDCVELNPLLVSWCQSKLSRRQKEQIHFIVDDPRSYLRSAEKSYDCILMNIAAPASVALNRYFSQDFFALIKKNLTQKGVFAFFVPSQRDILSPRYVQFNSCVINTVDSVFKQRFVVPSDSMIILASEMASFSEAGLLSRFESRKPPTEYFTFYHLADLLDAGRRGYVNAMIERSVPVNTDDRPLGFFYYTLLQEAKFYPRLWLAPENLQRYSWFFFLAFMGFWVFLMAGRPAFRVSFQAALCGFASISLTSIIIMLFQIFSGALFWKVGIIIGVCMLGLAISAFLSDAIINRIGFRPYLVSVLYLIWFFLFAGLSLALRAKNELFYFDFTLYVCSLLCGLCTGAMYPLLSRFFMLNRYQPKVIAGQVYSADLLGAFLGTLFCSFVLLPVWGIGASLNFLMAVMLLCALVSLRG